jgi:RNA polymerase sigma factor (sigma-70 family)
MANAPLGTVLRQVRRMLPPREYHDTSDRELLEYFLARREEAAFVALLERHGPMVLQVCRRVQGNEHDAEDVFQATFLLLACKAGSIRKHESVASWLYGVAYRLALEAKAKGARRQARERRAADMRKKGGLSDMAWQELQATLDEALRQVPPRYRAPLLLCYLEGKTQEEAAVQLGCPLGTVRSRLARGRERLKELLERKGVRLSATALATALAGSGASSAVPLALLQTTAKAAEGIVAGVALESLVSARAAALLQRGFLVMATMKLKIATGIILLLGAVALGAAALVPHVLAAPPQASEEPPFLSSAQAEQMGSRPASPDRAGPKGQAEITIQGRVLDPEGKPLAGARLLLLGKADKPTDAGVSSPEGRFTLRVPKDQEDHYLFAMADGVGLDFLDLHRLKPNESVELRLVKDRVIRGRIVDTQGKPVAGALVRVKSLNVYANHSLDSFLAEWKKRHFMSGLPSGVKDLWREEGIFLCTTTDVEGRFALAGAGAERLVGLRVHGAGIADGELYVVNRDGFDPKPYNEASRNNIPKGFEEGAMMWLLYGPDVAFVAEAEKPIHGVVKEAATGKGRPGVQVLLTREGKNLVPLIVSAKTDAAGRYEIHGARKARSYMVEVKSDPTAGYMACQVTVPDTPGYGPVTADVPVVRGVVITGKVIDQSTGKPLPGFAMAEVLSENPFVKDYPEFGSSAWIHTERTAEDGTFRVVTLPGPVVLMGGPDYKFLPGGALESLKYKLPVPDPNYPQYFSKNPENQGVFTSGGGFSPLQGNFCKVVVTKPGTTVVKQDILVEQAHAVSVRIQDPMGRPLTGAWATGISTQNWERPIQIDKDSCPAYFADQKKPRLMVFWEPTRSLFGTLSLKGDEKGPVTAKLGSGGAVKGRLIAEDGKPLSGIVIEASYPLREAEEVHEYIHRAKQVVTDAQGAFQIDDLIPEVELKLYYHRPNERNLERSRTVTDNTFKVHPGERLDLGGLQPKRAPRYDGD